MIETHEIPVKAANASRVAVVGAGLVGSAVADALRRRGVSADIYDPALGAARPDAVPRALLHPATGPRAAISARRAATFGHGRELVTGLLAEGEGWWPSGCLRVTRDPDKAAQWQKTAERWPETVRWLQAGECVERVPGLSPELLGGVWISDAITLDMPALVTLLRQRADGRPIVAAVRAIEGLEGRVNVRTDETSRAYDAVVVAAPTRALGDFGLPPLRRVPGEVVIVEAEAPSCAVGEIGQVMPFGAGRALLSASHQPDGSPVGVRAEGIRLLLDRAAAVLPSYADAVPVGAWSGIRTSAPDRRPVVGRVAGGVFACTAFGSKGLLSGLWAADAVAGLLCGEATELPEDWSPARFG